MIVVGGVYGERCVVPTWRQVFGSGGRASAAVSSLCQKVELQSYCSSPRIGDAQATLAAFGVTFIPTESDVSVDFHYFHPLSRPEMIPPPALLDVQNSSPINVSGSVVLRFGMVEGDAIVDAETAVYDPQSGLNPVHFRKNGSQAKRLALVLNAAEALLLSGDESREAAARTLIDMEDAEVVVIKGGAVGATVWTRNGLTASVPAYCSDRVFKIGSGDVFSGAFAYWWGECGLPAAQAADLASRSAAWYCNTKRLPLPPAEVLQSLKPVPIGKPGRIYLAGPFFDLGQRWVVEEALDALTMMNVDVFSPLHEVGFGPAEAVAQADLSGLEGCDAVFAIINGSDPGTLFEIGYARDRNIPVVAFAEDVQQRDLTMLIGSGCRIVSDFSSAIYHALWASMR